ncbi:ureidoglycolate lyase [Telmatospirillum sp. J64-1]|uniref:ureidoglycolate lyase n=1 Tax=Telmatospirillum sp. J64-1 TaxID=2502183 RepID=UPI00115C6514|nr:ureidoglycolate lyase [Telmatospirillum sp. J64-1]
MAVTTDIDLPIRDIKAEPIAREAFAPFGELIEPTEDGVPFGPEDAKLMLDRGTPRFYIMRLRDRGPVFTRITRHLDVTQCLASLGGHSWMLAVAPPKDPDNPDAQPALEDIKGFLIPGSVAIKLHRSTWHAGPFFSTPNEIDFLNLELADTNVVDHHNSHLSGRFGCAFRFIT